MKRSNRILHKKFSHYLLPAMLTTAALSLSEFLDSMIVANMLGTDSMSVVQLGMPIMFIAATVYILIGNGGSTLYAICLGRRENKKAGKIFSLAVVSSVVIGFLLLALGLILFRPLVHILCKTPELFDAFKPYLMMLLFSVPFLVIILSLASFLAPSGAPMLSTIINVIANVVNVVMDCVYIKVFHMGVEGAALATLTGYLVGAIPLLFAIFNKKINLKKEKLKKADFKIMKEVVETGSSFSASQLGFAIRSAFCNWLAASFGSIAGIVALSLCIQAWSIVSIFMASVVEASSPIVGMLHGQRDFKGEKNVLLTGLLYQFIMVGLCCAFFEIFPNIFANLYHIKQGDTLLIASKALRLFSISLFIRGFYMVFMKYIQILGMKKYALFISLSDGFALVIPITALFSFLFGLDGFWISFPVTTALIFVICIITNLIIAKKSKGKYKGFLLEEIDNTTPSLMDFTLMENDTEIVNASENVKKICDEYGIENKTSTLLALLVEEVAVYSKNRSKKKDYIDILLRVYDTYVEVEFRSLRSGGNPNQKDERDIEENMILLEKIASNIEYDYIMGMHTMRLRLNRN